MGIREDIEQKFVAAFVQPKKQERSLFELNSKKKRRIFFIKLCYRNQEILDQKYASPIPRPNSDFRMIMERMLEARAGTKCYVMSYHQELDGEIKELPLALEECVGRGMPSIIISKPKKLAYFEGEQEAGSPPRLLLVRK